MPVALTTAVAAEQRSAERKRHPAAVSRDPYRLDGAALAREIRSGVNRAARGATESERDALAAMVAERIIRKRNVSRRGPARAVLAYIDRAERLPLWAERTERIERGITGREHIAAIVRGLMRDSREWRDVAETYQTRERRDRDATGRMPVESIETVGDGYLAAAVARESERTGTPERATVTTDAAALVPAVAAALVGSLRGSAATARKIEVALWAAMGEPLAGVAAQQGRTIRAVENDRLRGAAILRERFPGADGAADLVALVRAVAERERLHDPATGERPVLTERQLAALWMVEQLAPRWSHSGERGMPERRDRAPEPERAGYAARGRAVVAYIAAVERWLERRAQRPTGPRVHRPTPLAARERMGSIVVDPIERTERYALHAVALLGTPEEEEQRATDAALASWAMNLRHSARTTGPTPARAVLAYVAAVERG